MPSVTIDGQTIEVEAGTSILKAAEALGVTIPTFCYHDALPIAANCRICLVEIEGMPKPMPACQTDVRDGFVVKTRSALADAARKGVLEFILLNHPVDCPICDQAGECKLQNHYQTYSARPSRINVRKVHKPKALPIGPNVIFDGERCINCTLCVRFLREITGSNQLTQVERSDHTEISPFPGKELDDPYSLCAVDLCPVGALTSRDFRFKERVWWLKTVDTVCGECARGCNVYADHSRGVLHRLRPRMNMDVNRWWACDEGRLAIHRWTRDRLERPAPEGLGDTPAEDAVSKAADLLRSALTGGVGTLVLSPWASNEDAFVAGHVARQVLKTDTVVVAGRDDGAPDDLLRVADRNPNRAGVTAILTGLGLTVTESASARAAATLVVGPDAAAPSSDHGMVIVLTPFLTAARAADVAFPTAGPFERDGTWINGTGQAQTFQPVVDPPGEALPDWLWLVHLARNMDLALPYKTLADVQRGISASGPATPPAGDVDGGEA
ncbi:MAG: 2Fe-2S iron-sulfur cluster-binding protein [Pseudomonadota bacterium]